MENREIANVLDEIADLLEIGGENFFRVRAYRNAARIARDFPEPIASLSREQLDEIPGIGADLAEKLATIAATGDLPLRHELEKKVPRGLVELRSIRGLGPKRIKLLADRLNVRDKESLRRAAESGDIAKIPRLGEKFAAQVLKALAEPGAGSEARMLHADAAPIVAALLAH
ncbi:MAG TPA: helix-hairpin-helix domain-containing protein, partial [Candidatus Binataceae bacterium]|nr:helix-hairpin-helix domain-containing protein [Candidatus Binataceae bacterium]